ncbi:MAG TPA: hypothetical protein VFV19_17310 [Candidatus Polarisedimenticolaceae bacterium]|nr:hypothetical protein [Candidatus Polarisedimenticolaceae bacterium]
MRRPGPRGRNLATAAAPLAVLGVAAAFALRKLDDFDTFWHLAAGRFIARHGIPETDVLSHTVRDHAWINLQWAFDVAIYALHAAGGFALLSVVSAVAFTGTAWLVLRLVRPHLGDVLGAALVLLAILVAQDRFNVRPEMASFPLLLAVLAVLERARNDDGRGALWLVPLMLVWVNVHALFIVGAVAIVCAMAGSPSRRLAIAGGSALAVTLVNPYGWRGVAFPLKLLSRIDRSNPAFQSIAEFHSPFAPDVFGVAVNAYKATLVLGIAAVLSALVLRWRAGLRRLAAFDLGGVAFFAALVALSVLARRNLALLALGGAPMIARSGAVLVASAGERGRRWERPLAAGLVAGSLLLAGLVVTGWFYRADDQCRAFGTGVIDGWFPERAAAFAREAQLPGTLYNDLASGGYLAWDDPVGGGVFIDGRLEVYDTEFYDRYVDGMYDQALWNREAARYGVQTVMLFHHWDNRRQLLKRLIDTGAWALVYADESAAILVRRQGNDVVLARADALQAVWNGRTKAWLERPAGKYTFDAGRVEGTRAFARLLAVLGDGDGSVEEYHRLIGLGITRREEREVRLSLARYFREVGRRPEMRQEAGRVLEIDPGNDEARSMLERD